MQSWKKFIYRFGAHFTHVKGPFNLRPPPPPKKNINAIYLLVQFLKVQIYGKSTKWNVIYVQIKSICIKNTGFKDFLQNAKYELS